MNYYRVVFDPNICNGWILKAPLKKDGTLLDPRLFTSGKPYFKQIGDDVLTIPLRRNGARLDFNFGSFDMVVVAKKVAEIIHSFEGENIQKIPARIENSDEEFEIINFINPIECIDKTNSEYITWTESDGRKDKVGKYRMFGKIIVDPKKIGKRSIFRIQGWEIALIVSSEVKEHLESNQVSGIKFYSVSKLYRVH